MDKRVFDLPVGFVVAICRHCDLCSKCPFYAKEDLGCYFYLAPGDWDDFKSVSLEDKK